VSSTEAFDLRLVYLPRGYCNYRCSFCHEEGVPSARQTTRALEFDALLIRRAVAYLQQHGMAGVTISGGEPLLALSNVIEVATAIPTIPLTIVTNGTRLRRLTPYLPALGLKRLRINLNVPTFNCELFRQITGQHRHRPVAIADEAQALINAGVEVNVNCVVCDGVNDKPDQVTHYLHNACHDGFLGVRFLTECPAVKIRVVEALRRLSIYPQRTRRGGRVISFGTYQSCSVELVMCQARGEANVTVDQGRADLYMTARGSVKLGLWGPEVPFSDWESLKSRMAAILFTRTVPAPPLRPITRLTQLKKSSRS
jgi:pyruvate-formate lyase-activating enzyme